MYFTVEGSGRGEPAVRIVRGEVVSIIFPGTTNEFYELVELLSDGKSASYTMKPEGCYRSAEAARKSEILQIHLQVDILKSKLQALGDHSLTDSRWGRRG